MKILFISSSCSQKKYKEICEMRKEAILDPQQKFCKLLIDGIATNSEVKIDCYSTLPVSRRTVNQKRFIEETEKVSDNLTYKYVAFKNGKFSRIFSINKSMNKAVKKWCKQNEKEDKVVVCDALCVCASKAQKVARRFGVKSVAIITDLPMLATNMKQVKANPIKKLLNRMLEQKTSGSLADYDGYIPLTESMNDVINEKSKPYIVIEGSVDDKQALINNTKQPVVLYAGGICEKYGLKTLSEAFIKSTHKNYELHIYGAGSFVEQIKEYEKQYSFIKYKGCVSLEEIVEREKEASLLVNPRPSDEEFSKFSFPSKTLEYMTSGTPLLTTKLPGIPEEYFENCYTFSEESVEAFSKKISEVLSFSQKELKEMGQKAYNFVCENKTNTKQGAKIIDFCKKFI